MSNDYIPHDSEFSQDGNEVLPHSDSAEQGVLSCVIRSPLECFAPAAKQIESPDAFFDIRHKIIWRTLGDMAGNGGIDLITLGQKLKDRNQIDDIGGLGYLAQISDASPSVANLPAYLDTVVLKYSMRRVIRMSGEIRAKAFQDEGDVDATAAFFEYCARSLVRRKSSLPDIEDTFEMVNSVIPLPFELVEGILHQGTKFAVGGGSKASKSWILMDLALSISYGVPWLGCPTMESPVLYLNFEIQRGFTRRRIEKVAEAKGITLQPGKMDIWNLRDFDASYDKVIPQIIERIKTRGYSLIVFDPIYKAYGDLDENKAGDIAKLMNAFGRLNVDTGAALAFSAHFSKGNQSQKEAMDRISGSGVFGRDPDSLITFTAHETDACFTVEGVLRNLPPLKPFVVEWKWPIMSLVQLDPSKLKIKPGRPKENSDEDILPLLPDDGFTTQDWKAACLEDDISERTFFRVLKQLKKSKTITKLFSNRKWVLSAIKKTS